LLLAKALKLLIVDFYVALSLAHLFVTITPRLGFRIFVRLLFFAQAVPFLSLFYTLNERAEAKPKRAFSLLLFILFAISV
jgi:dolichol kinase